MCVGGWFGVRELFELGQPCAFKRASAGSIRFTVFERIHSGQKLGLLPCLTARKIQLQI